MPPRIHDLGLLPRIAVARRCIDGRWTGRYSQGALTRSGSPPGQTRASLAPLTLSGPATPLAQPSLFVTRDQSGGASPGLANPRQPAVRLDPSSAVVTQSAGDGREEEEEAVCSHQNCLT